MPQPAKKVEPPEFFLDIVQGSADWFELRRGIPTSGRFHTILVGGKGRETLLYQLAGELVSGQLMEGFQNDAMRRGVDMEKEAREHYERTHLLDCKLIGFVRHKLPSGRYIGASPDSQVGPLKGLEIKTMRPDLMIKHEESGAPFPTEHRGQCQGIMLVTGWTQMDLIIFYKGMPRSLNFTIKRDPAYINDLYKALEVFDYDLNQLVRKWKK